MNPWENDPVANAPAAGSPDKPWLKDSQATPDQPAPKTTATGILASGLRGAGPYATGAAIGGALAAPSGVGIPLGMAAGTGAVGLGDLSSYLWNATAGRLGAPKLTGPSEAFNQAATAIGVPEAKTPAERIVQSGAEAATGAVSGTGLAGQLAKTATKPVTKAVLKKLAEGPGAAATSGATSGAAQQTAAEAGAPPIVQTGVGLAGALVPYAPRAVAKLPTATPKPSVAALAKSGYVFPPRAASAKPSLTSHVLSAPAGEAKIDQVASMKNQAITNQLAAKSLGLPPDTTLTGRVLNQVRTTAGDAYKAVAQSVPMIQTDSTFQTNVGLLGGRMSQAMKYFPDLVGNKEIDNLAKTLQKAPSFTPESGIEVVKQLRFNGNANLKAIGDPSKHALGLAQRQAADEIDNLIERNLVKTGKPDLVAKYREARTQIAKSYDVEAATNPATGTVSARALATLADKGRPLTGELDTIAQAANTMPKAMRDIDAMGGVQEYSVMDFFGSALAAAHGNAPLAAGILARPFVRHGILSGPYQRAMINPTTPSGIPPSVLFGPITTASRQ